MFQHIEAVDGIDDDALLVQEPRQGDIEAQHLSVAVIPVCLDGTEYRAGLIALQRGFTCVAGGWTH